MIRKTLIVDDHKLFLEGLRYVLSQIPNVEIVGEASNGDIAVEMALNTGVEWVLMDINMPHCDGVKATLQLKKANPQVKVIAVTMYEDYGSIQQMIKAGADGYVLKNTGSGELLNAFETIEKGDCYYSPSILNTLLRRNSAPSSARNSFHLQPQELLTSREKEIVPLLVEGLTSAEIADKLFVSESTVISHRKNILHKFNLKNTSALVKYAIENGLLDA
jgi:DNA-binding NarL/FixJ family response regulator